MENEGVIVTPTIVDSSQDGAYSSGLIPIPPSQSFVVVGPLFVTVGGSNVVVG